MNATSIAMRMREAREKQGISYAELARYTNMSKSTLQRYETGAIQDIPISKLIDIARALNVSEQYLIGIGDKQLRSTEWGDPILQAYASAIRPTQEAACAVLGIPHVQPDPLFKPEVATCDMLVYTFPAAAGIPLSAEDDYERVEFPCNEVPTGADFGIRIRGDSMENSANLGHCHSPVSTSVCHATVKRFPRRFFCISIYWATISISFWSGTKYSRDRE